MLARIRAWWAARSRAERLLVAIGVPVAAIAALFGARGDRARRAQGEGLEAEGGPGSEATSTGGPLGSPSVINTGAPGVDTGQLASFAEAFTGEIGGIEKQLAGLETQFGQSATERAAADASQQAQLDTLSDRFEGVERAATTARTTAEKAAATVTANAKDAARARVRQEFLALFGVAPSESESTAKWQRRIDAGRANVAKGLTPTGQPKSAPTSTSSSTTSGTGGTRTYTVQRGDTLSSIGNRFGVPWRSILNANPAALSRPGDVRTLKVGYRLSIPSA